MTQTWNPPTEMSTTRTSAKANLLVAQTKLRLARAAHDLTVREYLNPSLRVSVPLTIAEIDALLSQ